MAGGGPLADGRGPGRAAALFRAVVYATAFVGFVLVFLPAQVLEWSGAVRPASLGALGWAGAVVSVAGAVVAAWCVLTFAVSGRGTPAPFDPPRRLVVGGPYRFVRNPMYLSAAAAVAGAALLYRAVPLLGFVAVFLAVVHVFVVGYEEPVLRRTFGDPYRAYCRDVRRWVPRRPPSRDP